LDSLWVISATASLYYSDLSSLPLGALVLGAVLISSGAGYALVLSIILGILSGSLANS